MRIRVPLAARNRITLVGLQFEEVALPHRALAEGAIVLGRYQRETRETCARVALVVAQQALRA